MKVSNLIRGLNKLRTKIEHIPLDCRYKLDGRKCNLKENWNDRKCQYKKEKINKILCMQKDPSTRACVLGKDCIFEEYLKNTCLKKALLTNF